MRRSTKSTKRKVRRHALLADVASMYYLDNMTQREIADRIGTTPSNVSRMISESQSLGVVKITIDRPITYDSDLETLLVKTFGIECARVVMVDDRDSKHASRQVTVAGANLLKDILEPRNSVGITWGTTLRSVIEEFGDPIENGGTVIQLAGSVGATEQEYDSVSLVQRLAKLLGARPIHLSAPFIVETPEVAQSLLSNSSNKLTRQLGSECDIVIVGIGSVTVGELTLFSSGYLSTEEIDRILAAGAVGEICGHPIDRTGKIVSPEFSSRVITIDLGTLRQLSIRIGIGARLNLVQPILAALRGGYVSHLVVDMMTANELLRIKRTPSYRRSSVMA